METKDLLRTFGISLALLIPLSPAAGESVEKALSMKPVQPGVEYEQPAADVAAKCQLGSVRVDGWRGFELMGPDGATLRRFADTNGDKKIDVWCYFHHGIEVYRDIDADFDGKADQYRWLGTGGTRWGLDDNQDGKIERWKQISAEEVTAEVVAALGQRDPRRFTALLIDPDEVKSLGLGEAKAEQIRVKAERAAADFQALANRQTAVTAESQWVQFAAAPPGVVPSGTDGSTADVTVYENAVAMFETGDKSGQLMVGTLIQVGNGWRLVELPSVGNEDEAIAQTTGNFFTPGGVASAANVASAAVGAQTQELVTELEQVDQRLSQTAQQEEVAKLHEQRAATVEKLIAVAQTPAERQTWVRQLVDTLSVAAQTGAYPEGTQRLRLVARRFADGDASLKAYADYQAIGTEYIVRQTPEADFAKVQEWYLDALSGFVKRYPDTPEAAQAWLQLGLSKEFEDKDDEALEYYKKVVASFPQTSAGIKAAGAVRRLESVGKSIPLEGTTIDGKKFSLAGLRGKPVIIHYWANWCEVCKQDMKLLRQLQARYSRVGLQIVGVSVDQTKELATGYLREAKLPWYQLFEEGGLESSPLATTLGVQTLPTMLLIDRDGKVVSHKVRAAELDDQLQAMLKK